MCLLLLASQHQDNNFQELHNPYLESKNVILRDDFPEDKTGTRVSEGEEGRHLVPSTLEHTLAQRPSENHHAEDELQRHPPGHVSPPHLQNTLTQHSSSRPVHHTCLLNPFSTETHFYHEFGV